MSIKRFCIAILLTLFGTAMSFADKLVQVTSESVLVSDRPYLLYYVSNSTGCYVKATADNLSVVDGYMTQGDDVTYYLVKNNDGTWKFKSKSLDKYFPVPTRSESFALVDVDHAGSWTLNFLANGNMAPYAHNDTDNKDYSLNRSNQLLHGWDYGTGVVNQLKLFEWHFEADATKVYQFNSTGSWMLVPTGDAIHYYLFDTTTNHFSYPSDEGAWTTSTIAVPVSVVKQDDTHYHITTKDGLKTFVVGAEANLTISENGSVTAEMTSSLNAAMTNFLGNTGQVTTMDGITGTGTTDSWYALRIHSDDLHPQYGGDFLYTLDSENWANGRPHPMSHGGLYDQHPLKDDATYYVRLWPVTRGDVTYYHMQVPNGKFVVNHNNDYPITWIREVSDFVVGQNSDNTFYIQSSGFRMQAFDEYIGKTTRRYEDCPTKLDIYKVNLTNSALSGYVALTPWQVLFKDDAEDVKLHCTRTDVKGLTDVYNRGYFFLPSSVEEPAKEEFTLTGMYGTPVIDKVNKTITVEYAPEKCFEEKDVTVVQGARTTGLGNKMQPLLRVEVKPLAPCHPKSFTVSLAGAVNFDNVQAWLTTDDQLYADGANPQQLGSTAIRSGENDEEIDGLYTITVSSPETHLLKSGESNYIWITADIKSDAQESDIVDASITSIAYSNKAGEITCDISEKGDPEGNMRIFYKQDYVWVSTENNATEARYYRNPALLDLGGGEKVAFCDYRYDNVNGLGKDYDGTDNGHRMDVMASKFKQICDEWKWADPVTIAAGEDATVGQKASGYSNPAVVKTTNADDSPLLICLMAKGEDAYDSSKGLTKIAMSTSGDGETWTEPQEISITGLSEMSPKPTSYYVTSGKGLTYTVGANTRVAFVINAKVSGRTREYLLYSDNKGGTWTIDPTPLSGKGSESKLETKNDGSLYVTGKAPASKDCNNDVLYLNRGQGSGTDAIVQTVIWKNDGNPQRLRDLRLYASFDQATTWQQLFTIHPDNAANSSMQKVSDDNLAIFFEDGSIGNNEKDGCYAMNYVEIHSSMVAAQTTDLMTSTVIKTEQTTNNPPYVSGSGWAKTVTTNNSSGFTGVVISASYGAFNRETSESRRFFDMKTSKANNSDVITITAPAGYVIKGYTIKGKSKGSETYTLSAEGATSVNFTNEGLSADFTVNDIYAPSTTFTFANTSETNNSYALISDFQITLARDAYGVKLNRVNTCVSKSYATLYTDRNLRQTDKTTKAYYVSNVDDDMVVLQMTENEGCDIPKLNPVLLVNSEGIEYTTFSIVETVIQDVDASQNLLVGTLEGCQLDMGTHANYYSFGRRKVADNQWVAGFYNTKNTINLGANKAYLDTSVHASRGFDISFDDEGTLTPVIDLQKEPLREPIITGWYTLDGRKVDGMPTAKGVYVRNGQKMIIK